MWKYILAIMMGYGNSDKIPVTDNYTTFIQAIDSIKRTSLKRIQKKNTEEYYIPKKAVDEYVKLFNLLECTRPKATIQCFYKYDQYGAEPYLVATDKSVTALHEQGAITYEWLHQNAARNFMVPKEDSPMALFQYLIFKVYGEQFALYWHALYGKRTILLKHPYANSKLPKERLLKGNIVDEELYNQAIEEGIEPVVNLDNKFCQVTLFEENHKAIMQVTYQIERTAPWTITRVNERTMLRKPEILY